MKAANYLLAIGLALPSPALTQSDAGFEFLDRDQTLGFVTFAEIALNDDVTGGCWTNADSIRARIRLLFEQNDIETIDNISFNSMSAPFVSVSAFGFKNGSLCIVSAEFSVLARGTSYWDASERDGNYWLVAHVNQMYSSQHLFSGPNPVNDDISDWFEGQASNFLASVLASRRDPYVREFKTEFPTLFEKPEIESDSNQ